MSAVLKGVGMSSDEYYGSLGERRLTNWGEWSAEDTARRLGFPSQVPIARHYRPDAGDVWLESSEIEIEPVIDDLEAAAVEQAVLGFGDDDRYLLFLAYVRKLPVTSSRRGMPTLVRYTRSNEEAVRSALDRLAVTIGQLRL